MLKIPWKNLYNDAVVATLDGLYLLVVPGASKDNFIPSIFVFYGSKWFLMIPNDSKWFQMILNDLVLAYI